MLRWIWKKICCILRHSAGLLGSDQYSENDTADSLPKWTRRNRQQMDTNAPFSRSSSATAGAKGAEEQPSMKKLNLLTWHKIRSSLYQMCNSASNTLTVLNFINAVRGKATVQMKHMITSWNQVVNNKHLPAAELENAENGKVDSSGCGG